MAISNKRISTPLTRLLNIEHPVMLAGMAFTSGADLAAAVSNAGGLGVIGALGYSPDQLREILDELKTKLRDPSVPFGIDLALPKIGGGARKTNHDYTKGKLNELIDLIIESKAKLFVSAVGVPSKEIIDRLHAADVLVMNMVGAPKHAVNALELGVDLICGQGTEGGGHTGEIGTSVLIPAIVDIAKRYTNPRTGQPPVVLAAGGIYDGRGLAASLMYGAAGVWVGTRFVASTESNSSDKHKESVLTAKHDETVRTLVLSGRPLRTFTSPYILEWESRPADIKALTEKGIVPLEKDMEEDLERVEFPHIMGQVAGSIHEIKPAKQIVLEMVSEASDLLVNAGSMVGNGISTTGNTRNVKL